MFFAPLVARGCRTKNSGNLTVNHFPVKHIVSPTIDTAQISAMILLSESRSAPGRERPINTPVYPPLGGWHVLRKQDEKKRQSLAKTPSGAEDGRRVVQPGAPLFAPRAQGGVLGFSCFTIGKRLKSATPKPVPSGAEATRTATPVSGVPSPDMTYYGVNTLTGVYPDEHPFVGYRKCPSDGRVRRCS